MRFNNILTVVPLIAISGCTLDDLLQPPTTLQPGTQLDAGDLWTWPIPSRDDEETERPTSHNDRTKPATTSTPVAHADDSATAAQPVPSHVPTSSEHSSETTAQLPAVTSTANEPQTDVTTPSTSVTSPQTQTSGNSGQPSGSQTPNDTSTTAASTTGGNTSPTTSPSSAPTGDATTIVTHTGDTGPDSFTDIDLDAGAAPEPSSTDLVPNTTASNPNTASTQTSTSTGPDDPTSEAETCGTLLTEGFDDISLLTQSGWVLQNSSSPLGTTNWLQGDANIFSAQAGADASFIVGNYTNTDSVGTISNWLVTPEVPLSNGAVLAFWTRDFGSPFADRLQVRMSTNGDSADVGTSEVDVGDFTQLLLDINPTYSSTGYPDTFTQYQVTVAGLTEPTTGRFALRYFVEGGGPLGSRSDFIGIDTVAYPLCDDSGETDAGTSAPDLDPDAGSNDAYQLLVAEGDGQTGLVGYALNVAPSVRVLDNEGASVSGVEVTFEVATGGGSVTGDVQLTDAQGYAHPGKWTLGANAGVNELSATIDASPTPLSVTFDATATTSRFGIALEYVTAISDEHEAVFEAAKQRWQELIIGDLPNVTLSLPANTCGTHPALNTTVDDLTIIVSVGAIDGVNGVLGQAGPCVVRAASGGLPVAGANGLPSLGMMRFDVDDLDALAATGQLQSVILHEMGHVLGINSLYWLGNGYLQNPRPNAASNDTHFSGPQALAAFTAIGGASYLGGSPVPVENCVGIPGCGSGTYNSHWREFALDNELMTGYVSPAGVSNPLSKVTVASLWDIGYLVNMDGADPYYNAFSNLLGLQTMSHRAPLQELPYDGPVHTVDDNGELTLP